MLNDLKVQAYRQQGLYGDNTESTFPPGSNVEAQYRWYQWKSYQGMDINEAKFKFLELAVPVLEAFGINVSDPNKTRIEQEYQDCLNELKNLADEKLRK